MPTNESKHKLKLLPHDPEKIRILCGVCNEYLGMIENHFNVNIKQRENQFCITGKTEHIDKSSRALYELFELTKKSDYLGLEEVERTLIHIHESGPHNKTGAASYIMLADRKIFLQNDKQAEYIKNIQSNSITFAYGPAGTGKTFLAVAAAVETLYKQEIRKIILVRPAVNAGESIGFLPGDINEKFNPYLQPFYDSLNALMPSEKAKKLLSENIIEIAPLAFMRGRTLSNAFIILDEGQNTTIEQMKMILTRIGHNSKICITGDPSQVDLTPMQCSGLKHANRILSGIKDISHTTFSHSHVVRHRLIQKIISAYEKDKK